jgi:hypothetical protein
MCLPARTDSAGCSHYVVDNMNVRQPRHRRRAAQPEHGDGRIERTNVTGAQS